TQEQAEALRDAADEAIEMLDPVSKVRFSVRRKYVDPRLAQWNDTPKQDAALADACRKRTGETLADEPWD
ncbi:MAG: hypothetical protein AAF743_14855, partial [Planctomycetota bacterium]